MSVNREDFLHIERAAGYFETVLLTRLLEVKEGLVYREVWLGGFGLDDYLRKGYVISDIRYHSLNDYLVTDIVLRKVD